MVSLNLSGLLPLLHIMALVVLIPMLVLVPYTGDGDLVQPGLPDSWSGWVIMPAPASACICRHAWPPNMPNPPPSSPLPFLLLCPPPSSTQPSAAFSMHKTLSCLPAQSAVDPSTSSSEEYSTDPRIYDWCCLPGFLFPLSC